MRILHVNYVDLSGRRFNGYDLMSQLRPFGFESKQVVLQKRSDDPDVIQLLAGPGDEDLQHRIASVEHRYSMRNLLYPWGRVLRELPEFKEADVVHYHQIHNQVLSLFDLPGLMATKPSIWTVHDPWAFTGHCVHPLDCGGWLDSCNPCPHLEYFFPMNDDCAGQMWHIKKRVYSDIDPEIVVASEFMRDMLVRSPLTTHFENTHLVPFGIEVGQFRPSRDRVRARDTLGIGQNDFVLMFRATQSSYKGLEFIIEALSAGEPPCPTTLLTLETKGLLGRLDGGYRIFEFGWVEDPCLYADLLCACDVFLMPSVAEAFGLMAVEAMAAGRPVVCFEGTAIESVIHAPECGISVPMGDARALRSVIDHLARTPDERERRGVACRALANEVYSQERYLNAMSRVYHRAHSRQSRADGGAVGGYPSLSAMSRETCHEPASRTGHP